MLHIFIFVFIYNTQLSTIKVARISHMLYIYTLYIYIHIYIFIFLFIRECNVYKMKGTATTAIAVHPRNGRNCSTSASQWTTLEQTKVPVGAWKEQTKVPTRGNYTSLGWISLASWIKSPHRGTERNNQKSPLGALTLGLASRLASCTKVPTGATSLGSSALQV